MTRERAKELAPIIQAYGEGKESEYFDSVSSSWRFAGSKGCPFDDAFDYRIKPEPKTRPMTRGEVLYMMTTTPAMVLRHPRWDHPFPAQCDMDDQKLDEYEYAIIDKHGNPIDGWHKFEIEE